MLKKTKEDIKWYFKHKRSNKRALKALKEIESYKGKIDPKLIKLCDNYSKTILGSKVYAPWLYVFSAFNNKFEEGWIPDNYYSKEVVPKTKGDYGKTANLNFLAPLLFPEIGSLNVGYFINGKFCSKDNEIIQPENFKKFIFNTTDKHKLVYKLENSKQGKGVFIVDKNNFETLPCFSKRNDNGVFQTFIEQHPFFDQFTKNSVATLRVTTVSDHKGEISARASYIRLGRNEDTHIKSSSAINISIDITTGEFQPQGYMKCTEINAHPDSNVLFRDKKIPHFEKCLDKAIKMHRSVPFISCLGWDLAIDMFDKIHLIEWNGVNNDIKFSQATTGNCFKGLNWENLWKL